ncbi:MAG: NTP transferase domain-containing protein [Clostridia bacterium]|nr:NTP transferase domain-containing protein [Clostridia bacterium]
MTERVMPTALILAGGRGMRLRPLTDLCPKPLLPVAGKAVISSIVEDLYLQGVRRCVVLTGYRGEQIKSALEGRFLGMELFFIREERPRGSAGCLVAAEALAGQRFFVVCADACGRRDYRGILRYHLEKGGIGSIFLSRVANPVEYGLVQMGADGRVSSFIEKPTWSEAFTDLANTGIYLFEREVFAYIPRDRPSDFGKDVFPALLADKKALYGYEDGGFWQDMGDHASFLSCNMRASGGKTIVGRDCRTEGAEICSSVLFDRVQVGKGTVIKGAIIGNDCVIGENAVIEEGCVLGDGCHLEAGCHLKKETVLQRDSKIKRGGGCPQSLPDLIRFFEESDLVLEEEQSEEFYIRLGYALARGAGGSVGLMHDSDEGSSKICEALLRGAGLSGAGHVKLGQGFYTMASACALYGGFALTALVTKERTQAVRILLFDSAGLGANGRILRRVRDAFARPILCGRVSGPFAGERWARSLYEGLLLEGVPSLVGLTIGMDRGSAGADVTCDLLLRAGARVVPEEQGRLRLYVSPYGRRCSLKDENGLTADFWHVAAIVLSDRIRRGEMVRALPERAPEALFDLAKKNGVHPHRFALCGAVPCTAEAKDSLKNQRFLYDGCHLTLCCLSIICKEGVTLAHLLRLLPPFATEESGIDCEREDKLRLLMAFGGEPAAEGVRIPFSGGLLRVRARGGRGLWLTAEAAVDNDARALLQRARGRVLDEKRAAARGARIEEMLEE